MLLDAGRIGALDNVPQDGSGLADVLHLGSRAIVELGVEVGIARDHQTVGAATCHPGVIGVVRGIRSGVEEVVDHSVEVVRAGVLRQQVGGRVEQFQVRDAGTVPSQRQGRRLAVGELEGVPILAGPGPD